jgi:hypothetical protein
MVLGVKEPAEFARQVEEHPRLTPAGCERVAGYGVMGLPSHLQESRRGRRSEQRTNPSATQAR